MSDNRHYTVSLFINTTDKDECAELAETLGVVFLGHVQPTATALSRSPSSTRMTNWRPRSRSTATAERRPYGPRDWKGRAVEATDVRWGVGPYDTGKVRASKVTHPEFSRGSNVVQQEPIKKAPEKPAAPVPLKVDVPLYDYPEGGHRKHRKRGKASRCCAECVAEGLVPDPNAGA